MTNEVNPSIRIIRTIRHDPLTTLQRSILHYTPTRHRITVQSVLAAKHRKICQADLIWVSVDDRRHPKVASIDRVLANMELEVAAIVQLTPLKFAIELYQVATSVVGGCERDVLAGWTRT